MADRAVDEFQPRLNGIAADLLLLFFVLQSLDMGIGTELKVDGVGVVDHLLGILRADETRQIAADLFAEREFAVRERAGTRESRRDVTGLAVHALFGFHFGADALFDRLPLFDDQDLLFGAAAKHLDRGENAGRTCADDNDVIGSVHNGNLSFLLF